METQEFHVGPIWNNGEAAYKVNNFLQEHPEIEKAGWKWQGVWRSRQGTSYADLVREKTVRATNPELCPRFFKIIF